MPRWCAAGPLFAVLALSGCAGAPVPLDHYVDCAPLYAALEARLEDAGVRDAGAVPVDGFPGLRATRFLASFRDEAHDGPRFDAWIERMRQRDLASRAVELSNLGVADPATVLGRLEHCSRASAAGLAGDSDRRTALREAVAVPDDYSVWQRLFGLYVVAIPFLRDAMEVFNAKVLDEHARTVEELAADGPSAVWRPSPGTGPDGATAATWLADRDPLGIPRLDRRQWAALAQRHAPTWWVAQDGPFDRIGAPRVGGAAPSVDASVPVTYWEGTYTRFRGRVLAQLSYTAWFSERPAQGLVDPYAGALDGVVWRVTLDPSGRPLHYDTIHACGCYHFHYGAAGLATAPPAGRFDEPLLFPQSDIPPPPLAIWLQSATHYVGKVLAADAVDADGELTYQLAPYEDLLRRHEGGGVTRSLFGPDGLVPGTERLEATYLWPAGVRSPGAMRQAGRQATAFIGRRHFDDPDLLEEIYAP